MITSREKQLSKKLEHLEKKIQQEQEKHCQEKSELKEALEQKNIKIKSLESKLETSKKNS